jgi:nucleoside-diphosphate-sugar epimerase
MRVFLTGVTGYVGRHVAEELIGDGHEVGVMVRGEADDAAARHLGVWPIRVRLDDPDGLRAVVAEVDAVAHHAASDHPDFLPVNRVAVAAMVQALRPGGAFVTHGGSLVFGDTGARIFDGTEPFNPPPFLSERAALERALLAAGPARGLRVAIAQASLAYGEGTGSVIPTALARAALAAGAAGYPAEGERGWSAVHVRDWARLVAAAVRHAPVGGNSFPAGGPPVPMRDLATLIAAAAGLGAPVPVSRTEAARRWGPLGPALFLNQVFSFARAEAVLGWTPELNGLPEELEHLVWGLPTSARA